VKEAIIAIVLYAFGIGVFRWLGGIGAAGEALRDWGSAAAARRSRAGSSSY
jgi:hypothetical protein